VAEESAAARKLTRTQQEKEIAAAKADGVTFLRLGDADTAKMKAEAEAVYAKWEEKIGKEYLQTVRTTLK
jgi:TRAP-type C4-dicarboxylate transport system substrate-binding protein